MRIPATATEQLVRITKGLAITIIAATVIKFAWWVWFVI
jgi:hypothetical protein